MTGTNSTWLEPLLRYADKRGRSILPVNEMYDALRSTYAAVRKDDRQDAPDPVETNGSLTQRLDLHIPDPHGDCNCSHNLYRSFVHTAIQWAYQHSPELPGDLLEWGLYSLEFVWENGLNLLATYRNTGDEYRQVLWKIAPSI